MEVRRRKLSTVELVRILDNVHVHLQEGGSRGNVIAVVATARELPQLSLEDALELTLLVALSNA